MSNISKQQAIERVETLLSSAKALVELAEATVRENDISPGQFDINLINEHGNVEITWYNSSESC